MAVLQRVRTVWTGFPGSPGYSNHYFTSAATPQACVDIVRDALVQLGTSASNQVTATIDAVVFSIESTTGDIVGTSTVTGRTASGTGTGDLLPVSTQGLVGFRTGNFINGRELRGRWFVPAMLENSNTAAGAPSSTVTLQLIASGNILINGAPDFVIYSRTHKEFSSATSAYSPVKWAVLRSRRDN